MPLVRDAHNATQMKAIRDADAKVKQKEIADRVPEAMVKKHLCDFKIERYTTTDLVGMFEITQTIFKDGKQIMVKKVIEGVYFEEAVKAIEKAMHWRAFNMK